MNPVSCSLVTSMAINPWQYKDLLSIELVRSQCWFDSPRLACCKRKKKTICLIPTVAPRPGRCDAALNNPSVTHHNLQDQSPKIEKDNEAGWDFERGRKHVAFSGATSFCHGQYVHFFSVYTFPCEITFTAAWVLRPKPICYRYRSDSEYPSFVSRLWMLIFSNNTHTRLKSMVPPFNNVSI